jgi:hypothetical protein
MLTGFQLDSGTGLTLLLLPCSSDVHSASVYRPHVWEPDAGWQRCSEQTQLSSTSGIREARAINHLAKTHSRRPAIASIVKY